MSRQPFATRQDISTRHPSEIIVLAADEDTREPDWDRVDAACLDASSEIRAMLAARYTPDQIDAVDSESADVLKLYAIDIALYRVSLSFGRQTEAIKERYEAAIKRITGIATGKGALTFTSVSSGGGALDGSNGGTSAQMILLDANERVMTRNRFGSY